MENQVKIMMECNDAYAPYLATAVGSIIENASLNREYIINVLETSLSEENKHLLLQMETDNLVFKFYNVGTLISKFDLSSAPGYIVPEASYRLLCDQLFKDHKILYLDDDIIVKRDVGELFDIDVERYMLGAVRELHTVSGKEYVEHELCINASNYFNAGVLLINLDMFRGAGKKALELLETKKYRFYDQDVLNIVCQNQVMFLDEHWNVEWYYTFADESKMDNSISYRKRKPYIDEPWIVHFTDTKPWRHPEYKYSKYFWEYAVKTPFFHRIIENNFELCEEEWRLNFSDLVRKNMLEIRNSSNLPMIAERLFGISVDIYGFGKIGKDLFLMLFEAGVQVGSIIDKNVNSRNGINIKRINEYQIETSHILVMAVGKEIQDIVTSELVEKGQNRDFIYGVDQFIDEFCKADG